MKNFEHKFANAKKDKNGYTKIRIRLYENAEYICVMAKPIPLTQVEMAENGGFDEVLRLNLTKFDIKNVPGTEKLYGKINSESVMYYNGAECAWKFYDNDAILIDDDNLSESKRDELAGEKPWFEPHNDEAGNYGDEDDHAVYNLADLKNPGKIQKLSDAKKASNYDKLIALASNLEDVAHDLADDITRARKNHKALLFKKKNAKRLREIFDQIVCDTDTDEVI